MTQAETLHNLMLEESAKTGLPQHFKRDLTFHDLEALNRMESEGKTVFYWRLRESGTQFSSHSEHYARLGWDDEQEHCYKGDLSNGTLAKLEYSGDKEAKLRQSRTMATRY